MKHMPSSMPNNETLLDSVPGFVAAIDQQLILTAVYGAQSEIIRRSMSAHESQYLPVIFSPEYQSEIVSRLQAAFTTEAPTYFEAQLAGSNTWYENHVTPQVSMDGSACLVIVGNDITPYKRLESGLEVQWQFLDGLLQTIPGWVAVYDHDEQKITSVNQYMVNFQGMPLTETQNHSYVTAETIHPDYYERVVHYRYHILPHLADGEVAAIEYRGRVADGSWRWIDVRDTVLKRHPDGTVWQTLGVAVDVTNHKGIEAELLDIQHRYQAIFDQSNDAILISTYDPSDMNVTELMAANPKAIQTLGFTFEELRSLENGPSSTIVQDEEDLARLNHDLLGQVVNLPLYERTALSKQGVRIPLEINMITVHDSTGQPAYLIAIARDISERKRHEAAIRESERFARSIVDALSAHIAILDAGGTIVAVNKAWREFAEKSGAASNVSDGTNYLSICKSAPPDLDEARTFGEGICEVINGEIEKFEMEYACHSPNEKRWFMGQVTRFSSEGPVYVVVAHEDITERKRQEKVLEDAIKQAQVANNAKSVFLAHMSHELRTPLNAILGYVQLLARETDLIDSVRQRLATIESSGQHLLKIINDVLDMARIEAGRAAMNHMIIDLPELLDNLRMIYAHGASRKGLQLRQDFTPDMPHFIVTDEGKLSQILTNLISNAIKFTDAGSITIHSAYVPESDQTGRLLLAVQDTGCGIAPDKLECVFQPFEQLGDVNAGTGLGLAISRNFARLMGGEIYVTSTLNSGSRFTVELPVVLADAPRLAGNSREVIGLAPDQPQTHILVVEDDNDSRKLLVDILQSIDLTPQTATDGHAALDMYQHLRPDVLLLDMQLPGIDGYEVVRRIRQDYRDQETVIIAVTASAFVEQKTAILESGCTDLLAKPFTQSQLFACLAQHTGVKFLYAEPPLTAAIDHSSPSIDNELLVHLSQAQLQNLYQVALAGSNSKAQQFIEQIQDENPLLAQQLSIAVDRFWITALADQIAPLLK